MRQSLDSAGLKGLHGLVGFLSLLAATPLAAQDGSEVSVQRTPENAQKFLSAMATQYELGFSPTPWENTRDPHDTTLDYKPVTITSDDACTTHISGPVSTFGTNYLPEHSRGDFANDAEVFARHKSDVEGRGVRIGPYTLDWSKVTEIGTSSSTNPDLNATIIHEQVIRFVEGGTTFLLSTPTQETASRIRLAMETLRTACDKTEGLGF